MNGKVLTSGKVVWRMTDRRSQKLVWEIESRLSEGIEIVKVVNSRGTMLNVVFA
jgi:hypothetical protein